MRVQSDRFNTGIYLSNIELCSTDYNLYDIQDNMQNRSAETIMGLIVDKLTSGSNEVRFILGSYTDDRYFLEIHTDDISGMKSWNFYSNGIGNAGKALNSDLLRLLALCSKKINHNVFNAEINLGSSDRSILINSPPLEIATMNSCMSRPSKAYRVHIHLNERLVKVGTAIRRRAKNYSNVKYTIKSEEGQVVYS